jgi:hypothetical protein
VRVLFVAAVVVLLAACGGSAGGFAEQANDACAAANEEVRALGPEPRILTAEQADWLEELTRIDRGAVAKVRALEPPSEERAAISSMLSGFQRGLARGAAIERASRRGDFPALRSEVDAANVDFSRARAIAHEHGLAECALLGRVDR